MNTVLHDRFLLITAVVLFLAGCKVGRDYKGTGVTAPVGYERGTSASDTTALAGIAGNDTLDWWRLFQDPVLDTLIREGLRNNRDLNKAILNIDRAATLLAISKADIAPKLNVKGEYTYGNYPFLFDDEARSNAFGGAAVSWELDIWGRIRRQNEAARAELSGQQYAVRAVQLELISAVASTYFELLEYRTDLDISQRTYALRDSMYLIIDARFRAGIAAEIDLDQARIQRAIAATSIPIQERRIAFTENALSVLLGRPPGRIATGAALADQPAVPEIPVGLPSELLQRRPDVLASEQAIIAQNALTGAAFAQRFPTLSLTGLFGAASTDLAGFTSGATAYSISGGLLGPVFHWGQNRRRVEVERIKTEQAVLQYEQTVLDALRDVEDALVAIETLRAEEVARQAHVQAAVHAEFLSKERYDKGVTSYLESLESQRQAFESQLGLASVQRALLNSYVQLYKALGGGWPTEQDKKAAEEQE
ncbi:MAG: efflux transporter outer membrane subunit [Flavobacteriales bacterium]|nr:efflux transporter outer membrane subunit [Flavobacteriales bacterium]